MAPLATVGVRLLDEMEHEGATHPLRRWFDGLLLELAEDHGVPIVDNASFDDSVLSILRHVTETLGKQGGFGEQEPA